MLDAVWSGARGWLTPPVLFLFINIVIGTIAVMSKLMSSAAAGDSGDQRRSLMRAPSAAFDRLRCFSFSRLGMSPEHHAAAAAYEQQYTALDDGAAASPSSYPAPDGGEWRGMSLLRRAPSVLRGFSFSRRGPAAAEHAPATPPPDSAADDAAPSPLRQAPPVEKREHEHHAGIERSQSEAAAVEAPARRRPRGKKTRMSGRELRTDGHAGTGEAAATARREILLPPPVEVDARADDFIRQFREELRLQRIDSILRYKDTLRRTGTV